MGTMVSGLFMVLLLHGLTAEQGLGNWKPTRGLTADQGLGDWQPTRGLTAKQGLQDLTNPTAQENNIRMKMAKFVSRGKRIFPLQPDWLVELIQEKYGDLEKNLVMTQTLTIMYKRVFGN